jgi:nucleoside-diphosphate-sugar epimerase
VKYLPPLKGDPKSNPADISRIRKLFAYEPEIDIKEGIARTVAWQKENL